MKENSLNINNEENEFQMHNSSLKHILQNNEAQTNEFNQSVVSKSKPVYSQKRPVKKQNYITKIKSVKFKTNYKEVIDVESFKQYNLVMCYEEIDPSSNIKVTKKCCEDMECILF